MIIVAARPGVGKALALDTPLPTPRGWTTMGDVAVGDELLGARRTPTRVRGGDGGHARTALLRGRSSSDGTVDRRRREHQWAPTGSGHPRPPSCQIARRRAPSRPQHLVASPGQSPSAARIGAPIMAHAHRAREVDAVRAVRRRRVPERRPVRCVEVGQLADAHVPRRPGRWCRPTTRRSAWTSAVVLDQAPAWPASSSRWR